MLYHSTLTPMHQEYDKYTPEDRQVWQILFERQIKNLPGVATDDYLQGIPQVGFVPERIPKFEDVNQLLHKKMSLLRTFYSQVICMRKLTAATKSSFSCFSSTVPGRLRMLSLVVEMKKLGLFSLVAFSLSARARFCWSAFEMSCQAWDS